MAGGAPNALASLKRAFRKLFKRGDKKRPAAKDVAASTPSSSQPPLSHSNRDATSPPLPEAAPQLPPVETPSPIQRSTDSESRRMPPTHPLASSKHDRPDGVTSPKGSSRASVQPQPPSQVPQDVSPLHSSSRGSDIRDNVSAVRGGHAASVVSEMEGVAPPRTNESQQPVDETKPLPPIQIGNDSLDPNQPAKENVPPQHSDPATSPPESKETVSEEQQQKLKPDQTLQSQTNRVSSPAAAVTDTTPPHRSDEESSKPTTALPLTMPHTTDPTPTPNPTEPSRPTSSEEKMTVSMEEPPPIRPFHTVPGMSATSGPLEDFFPQEPNETAAANAPTSVLPLTSDPKPRVSGGVESAAGVPNPGAAEREALVGAPVIAEETRVKENGS